MSKLYGLVGEQYAVVGESANLATNADDVPVMQTTDKKKKKMAGKTTKTTKGTKSKNTNLNEAGEGDGAGCGGGKRKRMRGGRGSGMTGEGRGVGSAKKKRKMASEGMLSDIDEYDENNPDYKKDKKKKNPASPNAAGTTE